MPNIKGISDNNGNISITGLDNTKYDLLRTDLLKLVENKDIGLSIKTKPDYDIYTHCYEDLTMKNTKRTVVMVCNKGTILQKEWWISKEVVKVG